MTRLLTLLLRSQHRWDAVGELPYARMRLAALFRTRREYRKALDTLTTLIAKQPDYVPARIELGRLPGLPDGCKAIWKDWPISL